MDADAQDFIDREKEYTHEQLGALAKTGEQSCREVPDRLGECAELSSEADALGANSAKIRLLEILVILDGITRNLLPALPRQSNTRVRNEIIIAVQKDLIAMESSDDESKKKFIIPRIPPFIDTQSVVIERREMSPRCINIRPLITTLGMAEKGVAAVWERRISKNARTGGGEKASLSEWR